VRCVNNYYYYPKALSPRFCDDVIKYGLRHETRRALTGPGSEASFNEKDKKQLKLLKKKRDSQVVWMDDSWIFREIRPWLIQANKDAGWNFQWDSSEAFQFTQYDKGQYYGWHVDSFDPKGNEKKIRKISLTLTLSKPEKYKGGELEFCFPAVGSPKSKTKVCTEIKEQGSIVFFPSFMLHRVKPITQGRRHSLVCWHLGDPFQ
tara:strand:- start:3175 stop:3786 length:612 start_codon:yes stop_codon:yes gene_type:complete